MTTTHKVLVGAAAAGVVALDLLAHPHGETWWHHLMGFDLIYGYLGCVAIVIGSKALGKAGLQRRERFYEDTKE